jgi:TolB-like protein/Flp pilus assembly protein TadD
MNDLWQRLKQRKLVQWALAYVAAAFALLQGIDIVAQRFGWPDAIERWLIIAIAVGFFVALVLAWYHGERGVQRASGTELLILALLLAIGGGALWRFGKVPQVTASITSVAASGSGTAVAATVIPEKSIAVLPLVNGSGNQDEQYFSDGLSEDLITALSQFAGLKVINRDSSFQFRHSKDSIQIIGEKLGVAHLLEGSVRRAGGEVRISAELVNAADGSTLWSQHYDRPYTDLFKLQDDITQSVADALKAKLLSGHGAVVQSDRPLSGNLDAYNAFLQGNAYTEIGSDESLRQAIVAYTTATRLDPHYARAWAALSFAQINLANAFLSGTEQRRTYAEARKAADTALALDPDSAAAHNAQGYLLENADFDWSGAEAAFRRALQLAPNDALTKGNLGSLLATLGQPESAVELTRQALVSDPRHATWHVFLSEYLGLLGRLDEAELAARTAIALQPEGTDLHEGLAVVEILRGNASAALVAAQQEPPGPWHDIAMTLALQIGTDHAAADAAMKTLIDKYADLGPYQIAEAYALRRDPDRMFQWLDHAWASRDPGTGNLLYDPLILRYKDDPRFAAFCKKVGLPVPGDITDRSSSPASAAAPPSSASAATP